LTPPQYRNFEPKGQQLYKALRDNLEYKGVTYRVGQTIPYDASGKYSDDQLVERYFNAGEVDPVN
jgi:hypothetical protein